VAWTRNRDELVLAAGYGSASELYRVNLSDLSNAVRLGLGQGLTTPAVSRDGRRLAFVLRRQNTDVWQIDGIDAQIPDLDKVLGAEFQSTGLFSAVLSGRYAHCI
jgi:hypothetical protein